MLWTPLLGTPCALHLYSSTGYLTLYRIDLTLNTCAVQAADLEQGQGGDCSCVLSLYSQHQGCPLKCWYCQPNKSGCLFYLTLRNSL